MPPAPPITNELPDSALPSSINDSDLLPSYTLQNKPSFAPVYTVGLILTAMLSLGALMLLFTWGRRWLCKSRVGRDEEEQGRVEDKKTEDMDSTLQPQHLENQGTGRMVGYKNPNATRSLADYRLGLDPIPEEEEEEERIETQKAYTTGLVLQRPTESMSSLSSLSSMASFKSEEDLAEVEIHGHSIARRVRRWADPEEGMPAGESGVDLSRDSLKLYWENEGEEKSVGIFEVRRAVSQNIEVSKAKLVSVVCSGTVLPIHAMEFEGQEDSGESSDSGGDGYRADSFCSTVSSGAQSDTSSL